MPKFVIAPDSFKDCLPAPAVAGALAKGIRAAFGADADLILLPIADGGEGTLEAISKPDERVYQTVSGADGKPIRAAYALRGQTAIVEMASAAGLMQIPVGERHAAAMTTYGVGELIRHAIENGAKEVLLTVGGSCTNDGGSGMLAALGATFRKADGTAFLPTGETLSEIAKIDTKKLILNHTPCKFTIATDVRNPLLGETGATRMFAPQKGATEAELDAMERGMSSYADLLERVSGKSVRDRQGAGAGGGIAVPLLAFADAQIVPGIEAVLSAVGFERAIRGADAILTGEGKMDRQSLLGKAISGVIRAAGEVPVYAFVGCVGDDPERLRSLGVRGIETVRSIAASDPDSIEHAETYLEILAKRFATQWKEAQKP